MLKKRLITGTCVILLLILLFWLDALYAPATMRGLFLMPPFLVSVFFLCRELIHMMNTAGIYPRRRSIYIGVFWIIIWCWIACYKQEAGIDAVTAKSSLLTLLSMAGGISIAFIGEMLRYREPGGNLINLTGSIFAIVYIGILGCFIIMLLICYGIGAVISMIVTTKMCDIGAYFIGKGFGKHKMAASLSPGKTVEGACGGLLFSVIAAWLTIVVFLPLCAHQPIVFDKWHLHLGAIAYGIAVGAAGALGDLAESFIKRDVRQKDSGKVPGFGGLLDIFDSLLIAAPVAFAFWAFGMLK